MYQRRIIKVAFTVMLSFVMVVAGVSPALAKSDSSFSKKIVLSAKDDSIDISGTWKGTISATKENPDAVITVKSGFSGSITIKNLNINLKGNDYVAAIAIEPGANVNLRLYGDNKIISGSNRAGIEVTPKAALAVRADGRVPFSRLTVTGGANGAGIGGSNSQSCGKVTFGEKASEFESKDYTFAVTATGGENAAGIGGGNGKNGGNVLVKRGQIKAVGADGAQDIGRGLGGKSGTTTFEGGQLVNYKNIGWASNDSAARQQVRFYLPTVAEDDRLFGTVYTHGTKIVETKFSFLPSSSDGKKLACEAYLYLPITEKAISVSVQLCGNEYTKSGYFEGFRSYPATTAYEDFSQDVLVEREKAFKWEECNITRISSNSRIVS